MTLIQFAALAEEVDDDPTCIECGDYRSEHGFHDHAFQRRLTPEEYEAEQKRFEREWEEENGNWHYMCDDPDDVFDPDGDEDFEVAGPLSCW